MCIHFVPECRECGVYLVATSPQFACCPNGHGKLIPRDSSFGRLMKRYVFMKSLPIAERAENIGRKHAFTIADHDGLFTLCKRSKADVVAKMAGKARGFKKAEA